MHVSEIDTPALVVDLDRFERNLARVADYARRHGLRLRPHTKTHKSIYVAGLQRRMGAAGLTVAKVSEAEVMLGAEPDDLLLAYPIVGHAKLARLMDVARRTRVTVALDSAFAVHQLADAARGAELRIGVLAEVDVGLGRVGVTPGAPLLELARCILRQSHLTFEGIAFYPGHIKNVDEPGRRALAQLSELLQAILADFRAEGIDVGIVSGGSTPTLFHSHELAGLTEIRPGTYVQDAEVRSRRNITLNIKALGVLNTHSGTCIGLLFPSHLDAHELAEKTATVRARFSSKHVFVTRTLHYLS